MDPTSPQSGAVWLPIVEVDFVISVLSDDKTTKSLVGVQRHVVEKVRQLLMTAKRNQIDGQVKLAWTDVGLVLQATALTIDWMGDLIHFRLGDDE